MNRTVRVLSMVLGGIVGGYLGYWIGHWAGWSTDAQWPWRIGGGTGAILTSITLSVLGVLAVGATLAVPAVLRAKRLRRSGSSTQARILARDDLGLRISGRQGRRRQYRFLVEMQLPDGTLHVSHPTQWVNDAESGALTPDRTVTVRYDPHDPDQVVVEIPRPALLG